LAEIYLKLAVLRWWQGVSHYPTIDVEGRDLRAYGHIEQRSKLALSDGGILEQLSVELPVFETTRMQDRLAKLPQGAIGTFGYYRDAPGEGAIISGWLCLNAQSHSDVWHQVLLGGYTDCRITVEVGPVESKDDGVWWDVENSAQLSITTVSIEFKRELPKAGSAR
jgi:hypothetical protein